MGELLSHQLRTRYAECDLHGVVFNFDRRGTRRHVLVDVSTLTKTPIPGWMREGLAPWTVGEA